MLVGTLAPAGVCLGFVFGSSSGHNHGDLVPVQQSLAEFVGFPSLGRVLAVKHVSGQLECRSV